jgi:O-antigen ligase
VKIQSKNPSTKSLSLFPTTFDNLLAKSSFWLLAGLSTVIAAFLMVTRLEQTLLVSLFLAITFLTWKKPLLGLYTIILLPVVGELVRLPFLGENGILIGDFFIGLFIAIWIIKKILRQEPFPQSSYLIPLLLFMAAAVLSLIQSLSFLSTSEVLKSSFYLVRFGEYALLGICVADLLKSAEQRRTALNLMFLSAALIALAGFIQLLVYPDLAKLVEYGWDPHQFRLVSTWLDPNFIGGFLSFMITLLLGLLLYSKKISQKAGYVLIILLLGSALFLTYSRSAYLALATGIFIIGLLKSRKILIASIIIMALGLSFSTRAQQRVNDLVHSALSIITNTAENPDATARLRLQSWQQTLELIKKRPWFGSGYNTLRYVKFNEGYVADTSIHSASGSDSSLLTILSTTGIVGLIPFLFLYFQILSRSLKNWRNQNLQAADRGYALGFFAGISLLFIHSLFVNSLLFPQILIPLWIGAGILETMHRNNIVLQNKSLTGTGR